MREEKEGEEEDYKLFSRLCGRTSFAKISSCLLLRYVIIMPTSGLACVPQRSRLFWSTLEGKSETFPFLVASIFRSPRLNAALVLYFVHACPRKPD